MLVNFAIYLDVISSLIITLKHLLFYISCPSLGRIGEKNSKNAQTGKRKASSRWATWIQTNIQNKAANLVSGGIQTNFVDPVEAYKNFLRKASFSSYPSRSTSSSHLSVCYPRYRWWAVGFAISIICVSKGIRSKGKARYQTAVSLDQGYTSILILSSYCITLWHEKSNKNGCDNSGLYLSIWVPCIIESTLPRLTEPVDVSWTVMCHLTAVLGH
jgi:hypothetical protein